MNMNKNLNCLTNIPHPWARFYKSKFLGMEVIIGLKHQFETGKLFWLVGKIQDVGDHALLFEYLDGRFITIDFNEIQIINGYSPGYFKKRSLTDPKEQYEKKNKGW